MSQYPAVKATPGMEGRPKIAITGTGSTGSTFLCKVLSRWFDTGGETEHWPLGLTSQEVLDQPELIKHPYLMVSLLDWVEKGLVDVRHVLLTFREPRQTIYSMRAKGLAFPAGAALGTVQDKGAVITLFAHYGMFVHTAMVRELSMTMLLHPRLALDAEYCWGQLGPLRDEVPWVEFREHHAEVSNPSMIKERAG